MVRSVTICFSPLQASSLADKINDHQHLIKAHYYPMKSLYAQHHALTSSTDTVKLKRHLERHLERQREKPDKETVTERDIQAGRRMDKQVVSSYVDG